VKPVDRAYLVFALLCVVFLFSGCAFRFYHKKNDATLLSISIGTDQQIGRIGVQTSETIIEVGNAEVKQGSTAAAVAGSIVKAAKPSFLP
jgi:hypothetical protein